MTDDKTALLSEKDTGIRKLGFSLRRLTLIPALLGYFYAGGLAAYLVPEYIHHKINKDYVYPNGKESEHVNYTYNVCHSNNSGPEYERYKYVQQETALWLNYISCAKSIPAIFANLIWTSYSDVIGRKILFISCTAGFLVKMINISFVIHFNTHLIFFLIGEIVDGFCGTYIIFFAVMCAFAADITDSGSKRTTTIVLLELVVGAQFALAAFSTGYYIKYYGFLYPAITGLGATFIAMCIIIFLVPETITTKTTGGCRRLISSITTAFKLYFKPESKLKQMKYFLLIAAFIFYTIQLLNRNSLETVYQLGKPFCWSSTKIGLFGAVKMMFVSLLGMGGIFALKRILADDSIGVIGSALTAVSYVVEGLAKTEAVLYTVPVLSTMSILPVPMIRSLMSRLTPAEKQGAVFATLGAFETLCSLIGALTGNLIYSATLSIMNGFVFLMLAVITAIGGLFLAIFMCVQRNSEDDSDGKLSEGIRVNDPVE